MVKGNDSQSPPSSTYRCSFREEGQELCFTEVVKVFSPKAGNGGSFFSSITNSFQKQNHRELEPR